MVHSAVVEGKKYTFGISGRLYKSNVLLYDHQTESLWSQLMEKAIAGPKAGAKLVKLPSIRTSWKTWRRQNPHTLVLSDKTGYGRDYTIDPYEGYYRIGSIMFPVGKVRKDLPAKDRVLGIEMNDTAVAYPIKLLQSSGPVLTDKIGKTEIRIEINTDGEVVEVTDQNQEPIPHIFSYWFAWQAFHPKTKIYTGSN